MLHKITHGVDFVSFYVRMSRRKGVIAVNIIASKLFRSAASLFIATVAFVFASANSNAYIKTGASPDNSYSLWTNAILSAKSSIDINIYEFYSEDMAKTVISRLKDGVVVRILMEGSPAEGFSADAKVATKRFVDAFSQCRNLACNGSEIRIMWSDISKRRSKDAMYRSASYNANGTEKLPRYVFNHAKYTIVDGKKLIVGTENYKTTGMPKNGSGNRGWVVETDDSSTLKFYKKVFAFDFADISYGDVVTVAMPKFKDFMPTQAEVRAVNNKSSGGTQRYSEPRPIGFYKADKCLITPIMSPENPHKNIEMILKLISTAKKSIYIEQLSLQPGWSKAPREDKVISPILYALKTALSKTPGLDVRVILNDPAGFFGSSTSVGSITSISELPAVMDDDDLENDNLTSARYIKGMGGKVILANDKKLGIEKIHNKGMIVDGKTTVVSSINWGRNSMMNNREAGLLIDQCPEVADYYSDLFAKDWKAQFLK